MNLVRNLERRLERLLEGVAGRAFSGRLHPAEIAARLAREADFARFDHPAGPATANVFALVVNPDELSDDPRRLEAALADEMAAYLSEQGLRVEGPTSVRIETSEEVPPGSLMCHVEVVPGPPVVWARLASETETHDAGRNRVLIGRADDSDIILQADDVSRRHAVLWREGATRFVRDLSSANGTYVDGRRVGGEPAPIGHGSVLGVSGHSFRFLESDA